MVSSSRGLNAELLCILRAQSLPVAELHRVGTNHAAQRGSAKQVVQHIEANVPPGSTHRDVTAGDFWSHRPAPAPPPSCQPPPRAQSPPRVLPQLWGLGA